MDVDINNDDGLNGAEEELEESFLGADGILNRLALVAGKEDGKEDLPATTASPTVAAAGQSKWEAKHAAKASRWDPVIAEATAAELARAETRRMREGALLAKLATLNNGLVAACRVQEILVDVINGQAKEWQCHGLLVSTDNQAFRTVTGNPYGVALLRQPGARCF